MVYRTGIASHPERVCGNDVVAAVRVTEVYRTPNDALSTLRRFPDRSKAAHLPQTPGAPTSPPARSLPHPPAAPSPTGPVGDCLYSRRLRAFTRDPLDCIRSLVAFGQQIVRVPGDQEKHDPMGAVGKAEGRPAGGYDLAGVRVIGRGRKLGDATILMPGKQRELRRGQSAGQGHRDGHARNADEGVVLIDGQGPGPDSHHDVGVLAVWNQAATPQEHLLG